MTGAVRTRGVHILGHPHGRIYGSRPGAAARWGEVFHAATETGVTIQLDGNPARQDLDYSLAKGAEALRLLPRLCWEAERHQRQQLWGREVLPVHGNARIRNANAVTISALETEPAIREGVTHCFAPDDHALDRKDFPFASIDVSDVSHRRPRARSADQDRELRWISHQRNPDRGHEPLERSVKRR